MLHKPTNRRSFLRGLVAAPAVIAIERLMPVRSPIIPDDDCIIISEGKDPFMIMGYYKGQYGLWIRGSLIVNGLITANKMAADTLEVPFV